jgi:hypothetical protein
MVSQRLFRPSAVYATNMHCSSPTFRGSFVPLLSTWIIVPTFKNNLLLRGPSFYFLDVGYCSYQLARRKGQELSNLKQYRFENP